VALARKNHQFNWWNGNALASRKNSYAKIDVVPQPQAVKE